MCSVPAVIVRRDVPRCRPFVPAWCTNKTAMPRRRSLSNQFCIGSSVDLVIFDNLSTLCTNGSESDPRLAGRSVATPQCRIVTIRPKLLAAVSGHKQSISDSPEPEPPRLRLTDPAAWRRPLGL